MANGVLISAFVYDGLPTLSAIFGFFKTSSGAQIQRIQIAAQTGPIGGNITVQLIDQTGAAYSGAQIILGSGTTYYDQPLAAPITLGLNQIVRAQITGVDIGVASDLVVNLIGATTQGATAPSGCGPSNCQPPQAQLLFFQGSVQNEVAAAQAAQLAAQNSAAQAQQSATDSDDAKIAAEVAAAAAEAARVNAEAQVVQAANWATNSNNAALASSVYAGQSQASANLSQSYASAAAVSAAEAAAQAADAQTRKAATLQLTVASVQAIADATPTTVSWNNAMFDDLGFFDAGNPTRLTIPANRGIFRVRVTAGIRWAASAVGNRSVKIRANPVGIYSANTFVASDERDSGASGDATLQTGIIQVEEGMYFEIIVEQNSGGALNINTATAAANVSNFFTIEVLGRTV